MQGDVPRKELDLPPFHSSSLPEAKVGKAEAKGPAACCTRAVFSTILHLLLGSQRPAAGLKANRLCQRGHRVSPSVVIPCRPHAGSRGVSSTGLGGRLGGIRTSSG